MKTPRGPLVGSVALGILSSACCIGPLVFATLGIAGAAAAQRLEPLRPHFLVATYVLTKKIAESVSKTGFEASVKTPVEVPKAK